MDDSAGWAVAAFFAIAFGGAALGGLIGWLTRFEIGMSAGLLCIAAGALGVAVYLAVINLEGFRGMLLAPAVLVDYQKADTEPVARGEPRRAAGWMPVVEFAAGDGKKYRVVGLAKGTRDVEPGTTMVVRYRPLQPGAGRVADFQNDWGAVFAMSLFGGFPLLGGLYFLFSAIAAARETASARRGYRRDVVPTSRWAAWCETRGRRHAVWLNRTAMACICAALLYPALGAEPGMREIGSAFIGVAGGALLYGVSAVISNRGWQSVYICFILVAGFGAFGTFAVLLTQPAADAAAARRVGGDWHRAGK